MSEFGTSPPHNSDKPHKMVAIINNNKIILVLKSHPFVLKFTCLVFFFHKLCICLPSIIEDLAS